jgi:hypothetical protein
VIDTISRYFIWTIMRFPVTLLNKWPRFNAPIPLLIETIVLQKLYSLFQRQNQFMDVVNHLCNICKITLSENPIWLKVENELLAIRSTLKHARQIGVGLWIGRPGLDSSTVQITFVLIDHEIFLPSFALYHCSDMYGGEWRHLVLKYCSTGLNRNGAEAELCSGEFNLTRMYLVKKLVCSFTLLLNQSGWILACVNEKLVLFIWN